MLFGFEDPNAREVGRIDDSALGFSPSRQDPSTSRPDQASPWFYALAGLLAGIAAVGLAWTLWPDPEPGLSPADLDRAVTAALERATDDQTSATSAFDRVAPSLVAVRAIDGADDTSPTIGAGVIINDQGQILTAHHVVATAASIRLMFADGTEATARIDSTDPRRDIAVLSAADRAPVTTPAVLGNPRTLEIGDPIYAVGNPLGLTSSMTSGVISGLGRNIPFPESDELVLEDLIQFDAAVNQGSSGGPLLNADGQVIGIVTALADPAGQGFFIGIGFAVPIDVAAGGVADGPAQ